MEVLVIFLLVFLMVLILGLRSTMSKKMEGLEKEIIRLRQEWARPQPPPAMPIPATPKETEPSTPKETMPVNPEVSRPHVFPERRPTALHATPPTAMPPVAPLPRPPQPPPPPPAPPRPGFFERHPDLEKFIGENLISKIGIAILVLAIGFFVKYAIDNDWIGPVGRVGIGLLCGGILTGVAHWLRNSYKGFSSVLVGGGLAVFYFTITLAYHQYALFGQATAFIIMLVITAFSVLLSLLYDRQELAIIALVGGFVAPYLASNGSGNYKILFGYLLILNAGLLVIAYNKAWRLLNALAFAFTAILFASWLISLPNGTAVSTYDGGFWFATAFYILFFTINIAHNILENRKFIASDFGILLANTCLYFAAGLYLLVHMQAIRYQGLFSATMGVFNLMASWLLFRTKKVDSNILYLLIGITLSFISLTAPIQLHGHYITLFWASEAVLLYWLHQKSQIRIIRLASFGIGAAMLISLIMDWGNVYGPEIYAGPHVSGTKGPMALPILFNKGFLTSLYAALCCFVLSRLGRGKFLEKVSLLTGSILLFIAGALEINYQFSYYCPGTNWPMVYLLLYTYACLLLFTVPAGRITHLNLFPLSALLLCGCWILYLITIPACFDTQRDALELRGYGNHFIAHWAGDVLLAIILQRLFIWHRTGKLRVGPTLFTWLAGGLVVLFLSLEGQLLVNAVYYSQKNPLEELERVYVKTGLPILWGLCSFAFMWLGMRYKFKTLRIISLCLFALTLLKLFLFDIRNIPVAGKIAAFFCLGVLLLVVSFMYQRLKKIIIEDEEKKIL
jgi:uncharacterized membrane protein